MKKKQYGRKEKIRIQKEEKRIKEGTMKAANKQVRIKTVKKKTYI